MQEKQPIIGRAWKRIFGTREAEPVVEAKPIKDMTKAVVNVLGGFLQFGNSKLSDEKNISTKLLNQNKEWVYRNNDVIAKAVSQIEFELYQVNLKNGEIVYDEIHNHPVLEALDRINDKTTKTDAIYVTQSHKKLTGDAFWLIERGSGGLITNIFTLPPDKIEIKIGDPTDSTASLIEGYLYKDTIDGKPVEREYTPEQIVHFKTPNPNNMFRGLGAVEALAETIDVDNLTNHTTRKYFENGAITNFVLSTESRITEEQLKRLRAEVQGAYGGVNKAYKTMILGGGLKPEKISFSNRDMEFLAQLEWYRDKIMVGFGNTKASLGIIDDVNRASHESSIISWKNTTIKSEMQALCDTLNEFFLPLFTDRPNLILGFCDPVPEDREGKLTEVEKVKSITSVNERRELLGYDTITGGDEIPEIESSRRAEAMLNQVNTEPPKAIKNVNYKSVLRRIGIFEEREKWLRNKEIAKPYAEKIVKDRKAKKVNKESELPKLRQGYTLEQVQKYVEKQVHIIEIVETQFEEALLRFFKRIKDKSIANIDTLVPKDIKNKVLFDIEDEVTQAVLDFRPILESVAISAGQEAMNVLNLDDPYLGVNMRPIIKKNIEKFAKSMLDTDQQYLTDLIANGIKNGEPLANLIKQIDADFSEYSRNQAATITRTEVARVSTQASLDAFSESGVVEGKEWITYGATDECAQYDGQVEWTLRGNFYTPDNKFQDGDPPLHPNCKCQLLPVTEEFKALLRPKPSLEMIERIKELEAQMDKRTKDFKELKAQKLDDEAYIKSLEKYLGLGNKDSE